MRWLRCVPDLDWRWSDSAERKRKSWLRFISGKKNRHGDKEQTIIFPTLAVIRDMYLPECADVPQMLNCA